MNKLLNALKQNDNYGYTENGGIKHKSTLNMVLDMFGLGGAMRNRTDEDIILMFKNAYEEDKTLALRCLFYLRDARGGQGERRFFRVCMKWLGEKKPLEAEHLVPLIPFYGRWDDLYCLLDTDAWSRAITFIGDQLTTDLKSKTPSLLAKWLKSENASSNETKRLAKITRNGLGLSAREYRIVLSRLRKQINIVESLMSQGRWDEIEFDKIPSRAGILYHEAFARNDYTRERYQEFMSNRTAKVNAGVLNPVDIAHQIMRTSYPDQTSRNAWQKYWDCLPNYYGDNEESGIAIVDVSGSMTGIPMEAAVSMGAYIAERGKGPFKNHFITFSNNPTLVAFNGIDIYDKFRRAMNADWGGSTNIEAVFNLLLTTAINKRLKQNDMPKVLYIFSDMEFNRCITTGAPSTEMWSNSSAMLRDEYAINTVIEAQEKKWRRYGYSIPRVVFWNLDARTNNIPALGKKFSYISGFSPVMIEQVLGGLSGVDIMLNKLNSARYIKITSIYDK